MFRVSEGRNPLTNVERMYRDTVVNIENDEEEVGSGHDLRVERMAECETSTAEMTKGCPSFP